jgi:N-acetylmuramic acid 6-phosphate (MurNAc-6-P) etherase
MKCVAKNETVGKRIVRHVRKVTNEQAEKLVAEGWRPVSKAVFRSAARAHARRALRELHAERANARKHGVEWPEVKRRHPLPVAR